jgi:hypothetical protein
MYSKVGLIHWEAIVKNDIIIISQYFIYEIFIGNCENDLEINNNSIMEDDFLIK